MKTVSVIAPCRNERLFVEDFCRSACAQTLPEGWEMELIIADGMSDDGTVEILQALERDDPRIRLVENPGRIVSTGLNKALEVATGEVIVRMDVHAVYASDYVQECIAALQRTGADNVGGPLNCEASGAWPEVIAAVGQSRWVAGGALSRDRAYEGPVDTVTFGAWPRGTFDKFGGFDEALVRNQDDEHNLRITEGGGKIWQSAKIRSTYAPRGTVGGLFRQWLQYGYWKPYVMRKHRRPAAVRQLVPGAYVAAQATLVVAAVLGAPWLLPGAIALAYVAAVLLLAAAIVHETGRRSAGFIARLPVVIAAQQLGYGVGTLLGWADVLRGKSGRAGFSRLSR